MRLTRTHIEQSLSPGTQVDLPEAAANHLLRVLRLKPGDALLVFNGDGFDYQARILRAERRCAVVAVGERLAARAESPLRIVLAQGIARGEKMDWVLQKATELGVHGIVPIRTEWTEVRLDAERAERRHQHWCGVIVSACEQCGRATVPALSAASDLAAWAASLPTDSLRLALDPEGEQSLGSCPRPPPEQTVVLVVGPEGGLSGRDLATLRAAGFTGLRLGPRVLRTETAGLAALAALQALWGDLGQ
jgi:16S rRNA (uracil1498-N3)-methyltransferase